ncbi:MAG TPA: DUF1385 domain-containing protein, partial [Dehalococcoidia bacterium]|nr:DUF1385 domain-containing protein [Dehalococcoidia bacterium]
VHTERLGGVYSGPVRRFPLIRGVIIMWETLALGIRALIYSSNVALGEEEKGVDSGTMWATAVVSRAVVAGLVFVLPLLATGWLEDTVGSDLAVVAIEGAFRLALIVAYVGFIGLLPDVRRVYQYHGAEHKTIHAMEHDDPMEPAYIQKYPTAHVRCGTSFLLTVVVVSILVFAVVGNPEIWLRILSRVVLIPVIAAISYEVIRLGGAFEQNPVTHVLMWPNLALQALTTKQPDDGQVEVAVRALEEVISAEESLSVKDLTAAEAAPPVD